MKDAQQNIFLFGATGTIGRALVNYLRPAVDAGGIALRLGVRDTERIPPQHLGPVELIATDLDWPVDKLAEALRGSNTLFLLTGYTERMIEQSARAIDAARRTGITHVVHLGAHAAMDTSVEHLQWHLEVERLLDLSGIAWTNLRPNWLMQNVLRSLSSSDEGITIGCSIPADTPVSWVDADDVARLAASILQRPSGHEQQIYTLAPERRSYSEIAAIVAATLDVPCQIFEIPVRTLADRARAHGDPGYRRSALHYMECVRDNKIPDCADIYGIERWLGRRHRDWHLFIAENRNLFERR